MGCTRAIVVGAGLAGLNAALSLAEAGVSVQLVDAAPRAGGRCRSYLDPQLEQVIDNGNHFVFSGNQAVTDFTRRLGTHAMLEGPAHADFAFCDLGTGERWTLAVNDGRLPLWVFDQAKRAPGTRLTDYWPLARLLFARRGPQTIGDIIPDRAGAFWRRVAEPMMLAVLNCPAAEGSAWLAGRFLAESFVRGGRACRTLVATPTLDAVFVDPALAALRARGCEAQFSRRLRGITCRDGRVTGLDFGEGPVDIGNAAVILAMPPWVAGELVPGLSVPTRFCAILNAHFAFAPPPGTPMITALVGATSQWVVAHETRISVTISGADDIIDAPRESLAREIWGEICAALGLDAPLPAWQIVKEKRATFAATPDQEALRPAPQTPHANLFLAGDWVQTGLPATIEGALRSGENAGRLALGQKMRYGSAQ